MTTDALTLRRDLHEAEAKLNTARKIAEEAQVNAAIAETRQYPDRAAAHLRADRAVEAFFVAMDARDRCRRALRDASGLGVVA